MHPATEGLYLLEQSLGQLLAGADRDARDIVDRLVRVELGALPAGLTNGVNDLGFEPQEAEFEHLEQTARPGANYDDISLYHAQVSHSPRAGGSFLAVSTQTTCCQRPGFSHRLGVKWRRARLNDFRRCYLLSFARTSAKLARRNKATHASRVGHRRAHAWLTRNPAWR